MNAPSPNKIAKRLNVSKPVAQTIKWIIMGELDLLAFAGVMEHGKQGIAYSMMEAIDTLLHGHGVETIRQTNIDVDPYWMDTRALYVNMGDTYVETFIFDIPNKRFKVMSYGDFIEHEERKGCKF